MSRHYDPEASEANAARVRAYYNTPRGKELSRARFARYQERQAAKEHEAALARWVRSVVHAEGGDVS